MITLDPAPFCAVLIHKQMLPAVSGLVSIFAPPGSNLRAHLELIEQFNCRPDDPAHWKLDVYCALCERAPFFQ